MAGRGRRSAGCRPQLPVMASLVESGMKNLNFGDADSVGFFQMRVGIWNQGDYAGFPDKPELQVKWFLDNAEAVKKQRIAAGQVDRRPEPVRRLDRRRRAPRRAVPRALPAQARRGERAAQGRAAAPRRAAGQPRVAPVHGSPRAGGASRRPRRQAASSLGAAALQIAQTQKGVREIGGANSGPQVDQYLAAAKVAPGQPVVRVVRHLVARAGRAQDAGRRLGRRRDLGAATPSRARTG